MGSHFKYISDDVLDQAGYVARCPYCESDAKLYYIFIDDGTDDPACEICTACIRTLPIEWFSKHDEQAVREMGSQRFPDKEDREQRLKFLDDTIAEYRRTPELPNLVNSGRWPVCCADFTEYIGDAGKTYKGQYDEFHWYGAENNPDAQFGLPAMVSHERFEMMDPFSLFRCLSCSKGFWTHNVT